MRHAVIDVGSNTIRLNIYEYQENQLHLLFSQKAVAGLGGQTRDGHLTQGGLDRAAEVLLSFRAVLDSWKVSSSVFATASLRNIVNTDEVVRLLRERTGFAIDVISGEQEAYYDFIGASHGHPLQDGILADIGGASTEIVVCRRQQPLQMTSIPIGSLNLFRQYVSEILPSSAERKQICLRAEEELEKLSRLLPSQDPVLFGIGGTVRAVHKLTCHLYGLEREQLTVSSHHIKKLWKEAKKGGSPYKEALLSVCPERIHTLTPGLCILKTIVKRCGSQTLYVSPYGVREGYFFQKVLSGGNPPPPSLESAAE